MELHLQESGFRAAEHTEAMNGSVRSPVSIRAGTRGDVDACVAVWVAACAARDGDAIEGVAERARPKFAHPVAWLIAGDGAGVAGFVLATPPGSGLPTDTDGAAVVGLLAVIPGLQARGVGRALLKSVTAELAASGFPLAVLHALIENEPAVRLYESEGWVTSGAEHQHSLLKRPLRTYIRHLRSA